MNETVVERHPLWLRVSHWLNVPLLFAMCWSGFNMYLALAETEGFFYEPIYMATVKHLDHLYMFKNGMTQHFFYSSLFFLNLLFYSVMNFLKRRWRNFRPRHGFRKSWRIWIYVAMFATLFVETVSGFAIYKPVQLSELVSLFGSYQTARGVHLAGLFAIVILVIIHIVEVVFSGWNSIRSMVAGFKVNYEV